MPKVTCKGFLSIAVFVFYFFLSFFECVCYDFLRHLKILSESSKSRMLSTLWRKGRQEPRVTKGRCRAVIALTKVQSHNTQSRGQQVWWWQWGSDSSPGVARQICGGETKCKSKLWKQVSESGSSLDHGGTWPGMGRDPWQGSSERAENWNHLLSKEGSTIPFLQFFLMQLFSQQSKPRLCSCTVSAVTWEQAEKSLGAGVWGCTQNTGKCLQVVSYLRFCYFFHILCFFCWNI